MSLAYNRQKGSTAERVAADHATASGFCHAHRKVRTGAKDTGDVFLNELVGAMEVKATKKIEPSAFLKEATVEAGHAGSPVPLALWKIPRKSVGDWCAMLPYDALLDLLKRAEFPTTDDSLWRSLYTKALDDIDALLGALTAAGIEAPYLATARVKDLERP